MDPVILKVAPFKWECIVHRDNMVYYFYAFTRSGVVRKMKFYFRNS